MSITLSKGYKKPETGDRGFWGDLEFDIERLNGHKHDGVDSVLISSQYLDKGSSVISAANWVAVSGQAGTYKQTVTLPVGYTVDTMIPKFYVTNGDHIGHIALLSVKKASASTYDVFINDNTIGLVAIYG